MWNSSLDDWAWLEGEGAGPKEIQFLAVNITKPCRVWWLRRKLLTINPQSWLASIPKKKKHILWMFFKRHVHYSQCVPHVSWVFSAPDMIFPYLPFPGRQAQPERPRNAVGTSGVEQWWKSELAISGKGWGNIPIDYTMAILLQWL